MKMNITSLLGPPLPLLFLISCYYLAIVLAILEPTTATTTTVLDLEGNELKTNTNYYIFPATRGNESGDGGGGLALMSRNRRCPFNVAQESLDHSHGLPLRFLPSDYNNKEEKAIRFSTDINIVFYAATICVQSTGWRLGGVDTFTGRRYVTSGGLTGRPNDADTVSNWFKIEKHGEDEYKYKYKIVYCPSICKVCDKVLCGNVGVFVEDGKRWLGLSDEPLVVMFKKV